MDLCHVQKNYVTKIMLPSFVSPPIVAKVPIMIRAHSPILEVVLSSSFPHCGSPPKPEAFPGPSPPTKDSTTSNSSNISLKSNYLLHSKVRLGLMVNYVRGLALDKVSCAQVRRNFHISLSQIQAKRDIRCGKKFIIVWALGAGKS